MAISRRVFLRFLVAVVALWFIVLLARLPAAPAATKDPLHADDIVKPPVTVANADHDANPDLDDAHDAARATEETAAPKPRAIDFAKAAHQAKATALPRLVPDGTRRWPVVPHPTNLDPRRSEVVDALKHSWAGYKQYAWGKDEFFPVSKRTNNWGGGSGIGATIIDALDTLLIAGLDAEADEAIAWIEKELTFNQDIKLSNFETTIRIVGGLLSAYQITGRPKLLSQARDMSERLSKAFGAGVLPDNYVNIKTGAHEGAGWIGGAAILSEFGSLQMEGFTLSQETGDMSFWHRARAAVEKIRPSCNSGYCPRTFRNGGHGGGGNAGLGSFGDSFYEYLLKVWILSGQSDGAEPRKDHLFLEMWNNAAKHTIDTSSRAGKYLIPNGLETGGQMEHLACFSGGLFALSYMAHGNKDHLVFAEEIAATCHQMYAGTPTGLAPDVVNFDQKGEFTPSEGKYILRPETVETYFYLWKATKNVKYRNWGYDMLRAINKHLRLDSGGYAGTTDVYQTRHIPHNDNMETFWFAETLKYMYLLFSEDEAIDLKEWVFNTEAHPMRVFRKP